MVIVYVYNAQDVDVIYGYVTRDGAMFRAWHDRHGWIETDRDARPIKLVRDPAYGPGAYRRTVVGDRGQRSHRETRRNETREEHKARLNG